MSGTESSNITQETQSRTAKETWNILMNYAGNWGKLMWLSIFAAALSTAAGIVPYEVTPKS